ncbi:hypothetical protein [Nonomuraea sp. NPDC049695]|uniref:hypothetical protein n=1 Tax=Nonomuraea sp. NPDC049695 TaxID=3154734 RepID=UPI0034241A14
MNDQELRELLEHDSADGPFMGVTIEDIETRARGIRRRRSRVAGSLAALAIAVVAVVGLPRITAAPAPGDVWTGTLAEPTVPPPTGRPSAQVPPTPSKDGTSSTSTRKYPQMFSYNHFRQGGEAVSFTFESPIKSVAFAVDCSAGNHVFIWLNDKLVVSESCGAGLRKPPGWVGESPVIQPGDGANKVVAVLVPASSLAAGRMEPETAQEALSQTALYPADWVVGLVDPAIAR